MLLVGGGNLPLTWDSMTSSWVLTDISLMVRFLIDCDIEGIRKFGRRKLEDMKRW